MSADDRLQLFAFFPFLNLVRFVFEFKLLLFFGRAVLLASWLRKERNEREATECINLGCDIGAYVFIFIFLFELAFPLCVFLFPCSYQLV